MGNPLGYVDKCHYQCIMPMTKKCFVTPSYLLHCAKHFTLKANQKYSIMYQWGGKKQVMHWLRNTYQTAIKEMRILFKETCFHPYIKKMWSPLLKKWQCLIKMLDCYFLKGKEKALWINKTCYIVVVYLQVNSIVGWVYNLLLVKNWIFQTYKPLRQYSMLGLFLLERMPLDIP